MTLTPGKTTITQLTSSGTSTTMTPSGQADLAIHIAQSNGTGSVTAVGTAQVQYQVAGESIWRSPPNYAVTFSATTAAVDNRPLAIDRTATAVRVVWVAPTGVTSPTLDATLSWNVIT